VLEGTESPHQELIDHGGGLPELPAQNINLYRTESVGNPFIEDLADLLKTSFQNSGGAQIRAVG